MRVIVAEPSSRSRLTRHRRQSRPVSTLVSWTGYPWRVGHGARRPKLSIGRQGASELKAAVQQPRVDLGVCACALRQSRAWRMRSPSFILLVVLVPCLVASAKVPATSASVIVIVLLLIVLQPREDRERA